MKPHKSFAGALLFLVIEKQSLFGATANHAKTLHSPLYNFLRNNEIIIYPKVPTIILDIVKKKKKTEMSHSQLVLHEERFYVFSFLGLGDVSPVLDFLRAQQNPIRYTHIKTTRVMNNIMSTLLHSLVKLASNPALHESQWKQSCIWSLLHCKQSMLAAVLLGVSQYVGFM